jgi:hypothetical protein
MTYDLSRLVSALKLPPNQARPGGRTDLRIVRRGGRLVLALLVALATVASVTTQAQERSRDRPVIAAALMVSSPGKARRIATSAISRPNCCLESSAISTAAVSESLTQSETLCVTSDNDLYCVHTKTVKTSTNDVQMEFFLVSGAAKSASNDRAAVRVSSIGQADMRRLYTHAVNFTSSQGEPELATGSYEFNDGNSESLALRFNIAVYDIADYSAQLPVNGWRSQYYANPLAEGMMATVTPRYQINELAVSETTFGTTTERTAVARESTTGRPAGDRSPFGTQGGTSGDGTLGQNINSVAPLEGNSLLGSPFGSTNDYERRLRMFAQNMYIPPIPRPAPNK